MQNTCWAVIPPPIAPDRIRYRIFRTRLAMVPIRRAAVPNLRTPGPAPWKTNPLFWRQRSLESCDETKRNRLRTEDVEAIVMRCWWREAAWRTSELLLPWQQWIWRWLRPINFKQLQHIWLEIHKQHNFHLGNVSSLTNFATPQLLVSRLPSAPNACACREKHLYWRRFWL